MNRFKRSYNCIGQEFQAVDFPTNTTATTHTTDNSSALSRKKMQSTSEKYVVAFCLVLFLFLSTQLIYSFNDIRDARTQGKVNYDSTPEGHAMTATKTKQRICILAGPHKTASTSVQGNFYRWSQPTVNFTDSAFVQLPKPVLLKWIWPVPEEIARVEHNDTHSWNWAPSKVFYPLMEALTDRKRLPMKRTLFQMYSPNQIVSMFHDSIAKYWNEGFNVVFGTEAMDMVIKLPEGPSMVDRIAKQVLPDGIDGDQVTIVVMYRTPKIDHLISMWHQNCDKPTDDHFYKWISTTTNVLGPLDALGMVEFFLNETNWNVDVVNLEGLREENWDVSNFVACRILGEECIGKVIKGLYNGSEPVVANVRSGQRGPNVPNETLDEMDIILNRYDCRYMHLLRGDIPRLKIHFQDEFYKLINLCENAGKDSYPGTRITMREMVKDVALRRGTLQPVNVADKPNTNVG